VKNTSQHNLFSQFFSFENFHLAFCKAKKLKNFHSDILQFEYDLEKNLFGLQEEFMQNTYQHGKYHCFMVNDPKRREIKAAPFRDRVVHHALCNLIEPIFDKDFIFDSYACRKEKGTHRAIKRLKKFLQSVNSVETNRERERERERDLPQIYCLKCDIKKYFASIDHEILFSIIGKKIKDKKILEIVKKIIDSSYDDIDYENLLEYRKIGIPIGNLTSQLFANIYLNELDQFVKHKLKFCYYVRYMDDFLFLSANKKFLWETKNKVEEFLGKKLKLSFHPKKANIFSVKNGIDFLGYRVFHPSPVKLRKGTVIRFMKKFRKKEEKYQSQTSMEVGCNIFQSLQSFCGFAKHGDSFALLQSLKIPNLIQKYSAVVEPLQNKNG